MKFGSKIQINRNGVGAVDATIIGMKGDKIKVKCETYAAHDKLDVEMYGGIWVRKSQVVK